MARPLTALLLSLSFTAALAAQERTAADICRQFDRVSFPSMSGPSEEEKAAFRRAIDRAATLKADLAHQLWELDPMHARVPELLAARWRLMVNSLRLAKDVQAEVDSFLADDGLRADLRVQAVLCRAHALLHGDASAADCVRAVRAAMAAAPKAAETGHSIMALLEGHDLPVATVRELLDVVAATWPDDKWLASGSKQLRKQLDRLGQPLALQFDDLLGSGAVDTLAAGTKFTLCVFWQGDVRDEFAAIDTFVKARNDLRCVGVVSFRAEGGSEALAARLRAAGILWPQCYDEAKIAKPWDSPYATPRTPFFYLLDQEGKVVRFAYHWKVMRQVLLALKPE